MSLFVGYFDDSGRRDGLNPIAVVGGFVARPREWLDFGYRWKKILDKYDIELHHQNKWSNHAPPFDDPDKWFEDRRHDYINELIGLITSLDALSMGAAVPFERFDANFPEGYEYTSPFGYAAQCVFGTVAEDLKKRVPDARIAYVFESGTLGFGEVQRTFDKCLANPQVKEEFGLISLTTADKRDRMELQAADLMAYEIFKLYEKGDDQELLNPRHPLRQIGDRMLGSWMTPSEGMVQRSAGIQETLKRLDALHERLKELGLS